jgi:RNA polymerase sigma-70 factor, ECF subfamily
MARVSEDRRGRRAQLSAAEQAAEKEYLERLRRGEDAAFEELVRENAGRMLSVARRLLGSEEEARDAVQEAFLSAFRALGRFQGDSRLSTWLHRIAVNAALMRLRAKRRRPEEYIEDLQPRFREDGHFEPAPRPWQEGGAVLLEREELHAEVRSAIAVLPEPYRDVLWHRDIEELDTAETARLLGLTSAAVKTRLHRARAALREALDRMIQEETP